MRRLGQRERRRGELRQEGPRFAVSKQFTEGPLAGLTITDDSPVAFEVGKAYGGCYGSRYVVTSCEERASS